MSEEIKLDDQEVKDFVNVVTKDITMDENDVIAFCDELEKLHNNINEFLQESKKTSVDGIGICFDELRINKANNDVNLEKCLNELLEIKNIYLKIKEEFLKSDYTYMGNQLYDTVKEGYDKIKEMEEE